MPEAIPYPEGAYRPASIAMNAGYFPYNMYLQKGKVGLIHRGLLVLHLRHLTKRTLVRFTMQLPGDQEQANVLQRERERLLQDLQL